MALSALIESVDGVRRIRFEGVTVRHIALGYVPLSGEGARVHGGRWNPPDSFGVLYTALDRATMLAELQRAAHRQGLQVGDLLPRNEVTYGVRLTRVLDLRDAENLAAVGLTKMDLINDDWQPCQKVGDAAHYVGFEGIWAPSATGSGETLAVFLDRLMADTRLDIDSIVALEDPEGAR